MAVSNINDNMSDFGDIVSQELASQIKTSLDLIDKMLPIGWIGPIMVNMAGVSPNPDIWQLCDGSEITNVNSPLRSVPSIPRFTPNLTDRFIRMTTSLGVVGNSGGVKVFNFAHDHGGRTGTFTTQEGVDSTKSGLTNTSFSHNHSISSSLPGDRQMEPPFIHIQYYMKIQ
jgi:hypothetical protein